MPRVNNELYKRKYIKADFGRMVKAKLVLKGLFQKDLARFLGIDQSAVSYKIRNGYWTYEELLIIFKKLEFTQEEILRYMTI